MNVIAVKIHEDTRDYLPSYMKYSQQPLNEKEYETFLNKGEEGKGGLGFHECMNFKVCQDNSVKFYLPPGYTPSLKNNNGLFIIVWISYSPHRILGIQYNSKIFSDDLEHIRDDSSFKYKETPLVYHGETTAENSILFCSPMELKIPRHIHKFQRWGSGLRYLDLRHIKNIVIDRMKLLQKKLNSFEENELQKLQHLANYLSLDFSKKTERVCPSTIKIPDKELGDWGEELVYKDQLKIAKSLNIPLKEIFRIALINPQCVYDIESVKPTSNGYEKLYIEVKTTHDLENPSIFISERQIDFARKHKKNHIFAFVDASKQTIRYLSIDDIDSKSEYSLAIEKYRLIKA